VHPGNLNATPAIVRSVVLYVLRLLVREPLPLNEGLLGRWSCASPRAS
jgi:5-oxoprolinase (ATP-hydrolysing)